MKSELCLFQKFASQLAGISSVLEVMVSLFKDTFSAQLPDLHQLLESTLKAEQVYCPRLFHAATITMLEFYFLRYPLYVKTT